MTSRRFRKSVCAAIIMLFAAATISAHAQTFTNLFSFDNQDGSEPRGTLAQGLDGNYYGTTFGGGDTGYQGADTCNDLCGTIFKITAGGTLTTVHKFCTAPACADGDGPEAGLVLDSNDNFYGTTAFGGVNGDGVIFQVSPTGTLKTIYSFTGGLDGKFPFAGLVQGPDGDLYGTTQSGGATGGGVIFKVTTQGVLTTLYSFCNPNTCANPSVPVQLILGTDGNFYGPGGPTIFKITTAGTFTALYTFATKPTIINSLIQGPDGNFYGDTIGDGTNGNGTIFKFIPGGTPTILHTFTGMDGTGAALLSLGSDGNFYGTSGSGVFQLTPAGGFTIEPNFGNTDGENPLAALLEGTNGTFYGTTYQGGPFMRCHSNGCGTVYSLSMSLQPIVTAVPTAGPVGRNMYILGTDLTGTTKVTFNGVSATFTVLSPTAIRTTVPLALRPARFR